MSASVSYYPRDEMASQVSPFCCLVLSPASRFCSSALRSRSDGGHDSAPLRIAALDHQIGVLGLIPVAKSLRIAEHF